MPSTKPCAPSDRLPRRDALLYLHDAVPARRPAAQDQAGFRLARRGRIGPDRPPKIPAKPLCALCAKQSKVSRPHISPCFSLPPQHLVLDLGFDGQPTHPRSQSCVVGADTRCRSTARPRRSSPVRSQSPNEFVVSAADEQRYCPHFASRRMTIQMIPSAGQREQKKGAEGQDRPGIALFQNILMYSISARLSPSESLVPK
jgi:hypothetical protein